LNEIIEKMGIILDDWKDEMRSYEKLRKSEQAMAEKMRELIVYWVRIFSNIKNSELVKDFNEKRIRLEKEKLKKELDEKQKSSLAIVKENIKLRRLVKELEKVPVDLEVAQLD